MDLVREAGMLAIALEERGTPSNKLMIGSKILAIVGLLQQEDPPAEVTTAVFEALGPVGRKLALQGFCFVLASSLET